MNDLHNFNGLGRYSTKPVPSMPTDDASRFQTITKQMYETFVSKGEDYGNSYGDSIKDLGNIAGLIPIIHKCSRLKNLITKAKAPRNESLRDTLLDMSVYCILFAIELDKQS